MTRRRLLTYILAGFASAVLGIWNQFASLVLGQNRAPGKARLQRPKPNGLRVQKLPKELEQILKNWEVASGKIKTLQGKHRRYIYDAVFEVEKRASGVFYYEAPDKGRIDISKVKIQPGAVSKRKGKNGRPFKLESDDPVRWVCDGKQILQIDDVAKTVQDFPIPLKDRGKNMMQGPLPFLFGMPAKQAKLRYSLKLLKNTPTEVWLDVKPRWKKDAANWQQAKVILQKATYLPSAVQLIDPAGNSETVYTFSDLKRNVKLRETVGLLRLIGRNPFQPNLKGFKKAQTAAVVPSVINAPWKKAQAVLERAGYVVKFRKGRPTANKRLAYTVYSQQPSPTTPLKRGEKVVLTVYVLKTAQNNQKGR